MKDGERDGVEHIDYVVNAIREGSFRFYFFSREESRIHVHVSHPDGEAKFWLEPELQVATSVGLSNRQVKEAEVLVSLHMEEIKNAWRTHFSS